MGRRFACKCDRHIYICGTDDRPGVFGPEVLSAFEGLAVQAMANDFVPTLLRALFAGWLIALMVWVLPSAQSARLLTIVLITYVVAVCHLSHVIAGSVEAAYAVIIGRATVADYFLRFISPTLLGNIIGGVSLVGLLNHAAVAAEISKTSNQSGSRIGRTFLKDILPSRYA